MPSFYIWSAADFGTAGIVTTGTYTMTGAPDVVDMTDDDLDFNDNAADDPSSPADPGTPQTLTNDFFLDGVLVGSAGEPIYNAAEAVITNNTTGEVGRFLYVTIGPVADAPDFVGYASTIVINPGDEFTLTGFDFVGVEAYDNIVCFANGTLVETDNGHKTIESLKVGDRLRTLDNGLKVICWTGQRHLGEMQLRANPNLRPIRIKAGALGKNTPERDLVVSPQHRILVRSKIAVRMFDTDEIFIAAKHLLELPGVEIAMDMTSVTYNHIMCDAHEIVFAEGALAETLYTGTQALKALSPAAEQEISEIFGDVPYLNRPLARQTPKGRLAKKLVARHVKNAKDMVEIS